MQLLRDSSSESSSHEKSRDTRRSNKDIVKSVRFSTAQEVATIDCSRQFGSLVGINLGGASSSESNNSPRSFEPSLKHEVTSSGTLPLVWPDRTSKTKAIKVAPVDVAKLGQPRSRDPIIRGDVSRVSDISFGGISSITSDSQNSNH